MHLGVNVLRGIHSIVGKFGGDLGSNSFYVPSFYVHAHRPSVGEGILISLGDCDLGDGT